MPPKSRYEWPEARLYIFETLESLEKRVSILEDRERDSQRDIAINKTTVAIFGSLAGAIATVIIDIAINLFFK